jgi:hypothetical protein
LSLPPAQGRWAWSGRGSRTKFLLLTLTLEPQLRPCQD